ncbi:LysE family translocator [Oceanicola sp. 22II-s10i]|uniref:LysE family translocator n=1 Tax=Oceanicola sp. 22II-s10i TaxID=1317116 RepID=UPI0020CD195C|nr:LysE family transporter [Oceanicola sp. 22II-s10i]
MFGFRSTIPQIVGIPTGVISQILLVAAGLSSLFAQFPSIQLALKVAGTFYLLWLALKLWKADALAQSPNATPISFSQALLFQFINPKSWLIALTAVSAFLQPEKAVLRSPCIRLDARQAASGAAGRVQLDRQPSA